MKLYEAKPGYTGTITSIDGDTRFLTRITSIGFFYIIRRNKSSFYIISLIENFYQVVWVEDLFQTFFFALSIVLAFP